MGSVILYTTGCPKCRILEKKLQAAGISFETVADADKMVELGFMSAPMLVAGGETMDFSQAIRWVDQK